MSQNPNYCPLYDNTFSVCVRCGAVISSQIQTYATAAGIETCSYEDVHDQWHAELERQTGKASKPL